MIPRGDTRDTSAMPCGLTVTRDSGDRNGIHDVSLIRTRHATAVRE